MKDGREGFLLAQMQQECEACLTFIEGMDRAAFLANPMIQHAVAMAIIVVGQAASELVRTAPAFVQAHAEIPWGSIVGMRNRIAHGYYALDFEVVWDTTQTSLPELLRTLPETTSFEG